MLRTGTGDWRYYHRNQQYSVVALTDPSGNIKERYAYTAYGTPSVFDGAGVALASTAEGNRYTYTGREWDEELGLYHYRARMYDSVSGRFIGRDPIGYDAGASLVAYAASGPLVNFDPTGNSWISGIPIIGTIECLLSDFEGQNLGDFDDVLMGGFAMTDSICCGAPASCYRPNCGRTFC